VNGAFGQCVLALQGPPVMTDHSFDMYSANRQIGKLAISSDLSNIVLGSLVLTGGIARVLQHPHVTEARDFNGFGTNFVGSAEPIYGAQYLPRKFKVGRGSEQRVMLVEMGPLLLWCNTAAAHPEPVLPACHCSAQDRT